MVPLSNNMKTLIVCACHNEPAIAGNHQPKPRLFPLLDHIRTLRHRCLQAVRDFGSINAASEHLNKAKSAVSYSINKLEEQVGFKTLDRSKYRIQLTVQGEAFLNKAKTVLQNMDE